MSFETTVYGSFEQRVAFELEGKELVVRKLCVESSFENDFHELEKQLQVTTSSCWNPLLVTVIPFRQSEFGFVLLSVSF